MTRHALRFTAGAVLLIVAGVILAVPVSLIAWAASANGPGWTFVAMTASWMVGYWSYRWEERARRSLAEAQDRLGVDE